ncbi:MAG: type I restriction-modification system subunit M N-terminal domain-containing protein, partial [Myxococcales bacterium]
MTPQQRRAALEQLGRDRLLHLTDHFGLEVHDRRVLENHIQAVLASDVDFAKLLGLLKREELQAICDALGVDRSGREKSLLVDRILRAEKTGPAAAPAVEAKSAAEPAGPRRPRAEKQAAGDLGFEAKLWQAADKLRNNLDAAEYKHVVLGLIFLKYVSDAFEERRAQLEAEADQGADPEDPDEYRAENIFWVP